MNFLAHAFLAGDEPQYLVGNLMADFLRGKIDPSLPPRIIDGIHLHRKVDAFTDSHPAFIRSRDRITAVRRRYAPIIIDMFYDHFLAADWNEFSVEPLDQFSVRTYATLLENTKHMPDLMIRVVNRMAELDWFGSYATIPGITEALTRLSNRFPPHREVHLEHAITDLEKHYELLRQDFHIFMPDVIKLKEKA